MGRVIAANIPVWSRVEMFGMEWDVERVESTVGATPVTITVTHPSVVGQVEVTLPWQTEVEVTLSSAHPILALLPSVAEDRIGHGFTVRQAVERHAQEQWPGDTVRVEETDRHVIATVMGCTYIGTK
jgi:hypothetical protein